jgi:hypothetical protein
MTYNVSLSFVWVRTGINIDQIEMGRDQRTLPSYGSFKLRIHTAHNFLQASSPVHSRHLRTWFMSFEIVKRLSDLRISQMSLDTRS